MFKSVFSSYKPNLDITGISLGITDVIRSRHSSLSTFVSFSGTSLYVKRITKQEGSNPQLQDITSFDFSSYLPSNPTVLEVGISPYDKWIFIHCGDLTTSTRTVIFYEQTSTDTWTYDSSANYTYTAPIEPCCGPYGVFLPSVTPEYAGAGNPASQTASFCGPFGSLFSKDESVFAMPRPYDSTVTNGSGAVFMFRKLSGFPWSFFQKITNTSDIQGICPNDPTTPDVDETGHHGCLFGDELLMSSDGGILVIGGPGKKNGSNEYEGVIHVYTSSPGSTWSFIQQIYSSTPSYNSFFGHAGSLAMSSNGQKLLIADSPGVPGQGVIREYSFSSLYTFVRDVISVSSVNWFGEETNMFLTDDGNSLYFNCESIEGVYQTQYFTRVDWNGSSWNKVNFYSHTEAHYAPGSYEIFRCVMPLADGNFVAEFHSDTWNLVSSF